MAALAARRRKGGTRFVPPKTAEDAVPVRRIWPDGVCLTDDGEYAKTWRVSDVNYAAASKEDKEAMFLGYSDLLNSFDSDARAKVTVAVRRLDAEALGRRILIPPKGDGLDRYREEYNAMLIEKATGANSMVREIYLTIAVGGRSIQEARSYFNRASAETAAHLARLGAHCEELDAEGKLRLLRGFYRGGADDLPIDVRASMRRGHSFKDAVAPEGAGIEADRLRVGGRWARALYLTDYASYIKDGFLAELTDARRAMALSIDVVPVPTDEAVREVERRLLGVETNITNWTRRQNANMNYNVAVPYDMEQQRKESREFLDDLMSRDQRMMFATVTLVHFADTPEELDADTEALLSCARKHLCRLSVLRFQQLDGLSTALPIGVRRIEAMRTLTTESLAVLMPFRVQEIMEEGGMYFGENAISRNLILCDKSRLLNPNAFVLGVPGSGKSFSTKELIAMRAPARAPVVRHAVEHRVGDDEQPHGLELAAQVHDVVDEEPVAGVHVGWVRERVQRARGEQLQRKRQVTRLRLGLGEQFVAQVGERGRLAAAQVVGVHRRGAAVHDRLGLRPQSPAVELLEQ